MDISKIQSSANFGNAIIPDKLLSHPLIKGSVKAIKKASENDMVELKSLCIDTFDDIEGIKVSVDAGQPKSLFHQVDVFVRATKDNIKNKAVLRAVEKAVTLVNTLR